MSITRIKNNQITDLAIEAGKIANNAVTAGKLEDNMTYGSNLTISGNLTVNGTTTTVDSTNTQVADPLMLLSRGATGSASVDAGLIIERGDDNNVAMIWDESADQFIVAVTASEDGTTAGDVTVSSYANLQAGTVTVSALSLTGTFDADNIRIDGNTISSTDTNGNINLTPNGTGEVVAATLTVSDLTDNRIVIAGSSGALEDDGNLTFDGTTLAATAAVDITGDLDVDNININGNTIISSDTNGNISLTPNGTGEVVLSTATVSDLTDNRVVIAGSSGALEDDANFTYDGTDLTVNSAIVGDLTNNRVVIAGTSGALEDDANFTFDGTTMAITAAVDVTGDLDVDNININGNTIISTDTNGNISLTPNGTGEVVMSTATVSDLTNNRVVIAGTSGVLEDDANLTWDGSTLTAGGDVSSTTLQTSGEATLASAIVSDLTDNRVVIAGTSGALEDDANFTFDGTTLALTAGMDITGDLDVDNINVNGNAITSTDTNGNITITPNGTGDLVLDGLNWPQADGTAGYVLKTDGSAQLSWVSVLTDLAFDTTPQLGGDLDTNGFKITSARSNEDIEIDPAGTGEVVISTAVVSDLTDNRVVIAGTAGALEDDSNLTYDGTDLSTNSLIVGDLTNNRVLVAGTSGAVEDDANFTWDGSALAVTGGVDVTGDLDVDNININGNTIISSDTNGDVNITPNGSGEVVLSTVAVSDLTDNRVLLAGTSGAIEDDGNFTFDGTTMSITAAVDITGDLDVDNLNLNGNTVSATDTNGNVTIAPNGTGEVVVGTGSAAATITSNGAYDLTLDTNSGTNSGSITITDGANGAITVNPNGSGTVDVGNTATVVNINGTTGSTGSGNGALVVDGGVGIAENLEVGGNIVVAGNLTVEGTTTTVDSVTTQVVDPIFQIGGGAGGAALSADDNKDRGMSAKYHTGSEEKTAFWGFDDSTGRWTFVPDATISGEVVSGTVGALDVGDIYNGNLTATRITYATANGQLTDTADMVYDGTDTTIASLIVSDLTDNRIVIAGSSGAVEDDANLTWDGSDMGVTGGLNVTGDLAVDNLAMNGNDITSTNTNGAINLTPNGTGEVVAATLTVSDITDNRVVIGGTSGALEDSANLTFDGSTLTVTGNIAIDNLDLNGNTLSSTDTDGHVNITPNGAGNVNLSADTVVVGDSNADATITTNGTGDLTLNTNSGTNSGSIVIADAANGNISITPNGTGDLVLDGLNWPQADGTAGYVLTTDGSGQLSWADSGTSVVADTTPQLGGDLDVNGFKITSARSNEDIQIDPNGTGEVVLSTAVVSDLTDNRVVIAGTAGALEDDGNFTFDGSTLTVGGDVSSTTLQTSGEATLASATVSDLTANRVVLAGTSGALQDSANFTFNGTTMAITGAVDVTGDLDVDNININGNTIISTDTNGDVNITPNGTGETVISTAAVSDLTSGRIVTAGTSGALEDSASLLWDGTDLTAGSAIISDLTDNRVVIAGTSGALEDDANFTFDGTTLALTAAMDITGDLDVDNINVNGNTVSATDTNGNVNIAPNGTGEVVVGTGAAGATVTSSGAYDLTLDTNSGTNSGTIVITDGANGNITLTPNGTGEVVASTAVVSDLTSGRVVLAGTSGAIEDSGNLTFDGTTLTVTGNIAVDNLDLDGNNITATSGGVVTINDAGADVDFRVEGDTNANLLVVDAGSDSVSIGTATQTADVIFKVGSTDSMMIPVGTTGERPGTGVDGMLRLNSSTNKMEYYANSEWKTADSAFTVIASDTFDGDGSTVAFTLGATQTTAGCVVSINGIVQLPVTAYGVSSSTLTFTEAPASGDKIEVRRFTTTTTINEIEITANNTTDETTYILFADGATGAQALESDTGLTYNPSSNTLTTTTFSGTATTAQYADLAEQYASDEDIEAGTVVHFAGNGKVAPCDTDACTKVAGIVSTDPAHLMNSSQEGVPLALAGRVPCKVTGTVNAGDLMVSAGNGLARAEANPAIGTVIGKAIEDFSGEGEGVIEVLALMM